jgi:LmbE family N-acetylglucosaminyl deacetylase
MKKLLVIEAHSDDSAISALGFLEKCKSEYEYHFVLASVSDLALHHAGMVSRDMRLEEYTKYMKHLRGIWHRHNGLPFDADARLDMLPKRELVAAFEKIIAEVRPDVLICQGPSFHHDHTITYEAAIAATRPTARFYPSEIYIMENPTYVHSLGPSTDFKATMYCSLTEEQINYKLEILKQCFPSQIREGKNCLSSAGIKDWARYRGVECRSDYAEAFKLYSRVI